MAKDHQVLKGVRLSRSEVRMLAGDDAIATVAEHDCERQGVCSVCWLLERNCTCS